MLLLQKVLVFASRASMEGLSLSLLPYWNQEQCPPGRNQRAESISRNQGRLAKRAGNYPAICKAGFGSFSLGPPGNYLPLPYSESLGRCLKLSIRPQFFPQVFVLCPEVHIAVLNLATGKALCNSDRFIFPTWLPCGIWGPLRTFLEGIGLEWSGGGSEEQETLKSLSDTSWNTSHFLVIPLCPRASRPRGHLPLFWSDKADAKTWALR